MLSKKNIYGIENKSTIMKTTLFSVKNLIIEYFLMDMFHQLLS